MLPGERDLQATPATYVPTKRFFESHVFFYRSPRPRHQSDPAMCHQLYSEYQQ